ncbi:toll/interleukin-1 receptor domain-containing protein, partial [Vibrio sp. FNV 38]|nr:toll/interleukin-1 receptor domain-containing protein [Vibrio sp. FNV 38]
MEQKMNEFAYDVFISYSHRDMQWAKWLQNKLETFRVPKDMAGNTLSGRRLKVFRDQTDLAGAELQASLRKELAASRYLVVLCTPASAASVWVNEEVRQFQS